MKNFAIYRHPAGLYEPVKVGWSWPAFFFGTLWLLVKRMWLAFFVVLLVGVLVPFFLFGSDNIDESMALRLYNLFAIFESVGFAVFGNGLREWYLRRRGFVRVGYCQGTNMGMALAMFVIQAREHEQGYGQGDAGSPETHRGNGGQTVDTTAQPVMGSVPSMVHTECTDDSNAVVGSTRRP